MGATFSDGTAPPNTPIVLVWETETDGQSTALKIREAQSVLTGERVASPFVGKYIGNNGFVDTFAEAFKFSGHDTAYPIVQYSVDGQSNWHSAYSANDEYFRIQTGLNAFSEPVHMTGMGLNQAEVDARIAPFAREGNADELPIEKIPDLTTSKISNFNAGVAGLILPQAVEGNTDEFPAEKMNGREINRRIDLAVDPFALNGRNDAVPDNKISWNIARTSAVAAASAAAAAAQATADAAQTADEVTAAINGRIENRALPDAANASTTNAPSEKEVRDALDAIPTGGGGASITDTALNVANPSAESILVGASRQSIAEAIAANRGSGGGLALAALKEFARAAGQTGSRLIADTDMDAGTRGKLLTDDQEGILGEFRWGNVPNDPDAAAVLLQNNDHILHAPTATNEIAFYHDLGQSITIPGNAGDAGIQYVIAIRNGTDGLPSHDSLVMATSATDSDMGALTLTESTSQILEGYTLYMTAAALPGTTYFLWGVPPSSLHRILSREVVVPGVLDNHRGVAANSRGVSANASAIGSIRRVTDHLSYVETGGGNNGAWHRKDSLNSGSLVAALGFGADQWGGANTPRGSAAALINLSQSLVTNPPGAPSDAEGSYAAGVASFTATAARMPLTPKIILFVAELFQRQAVVGDTPLFQYGNNPSILSVNEGQGIYANIQRRNGRGTEMVDANIDLQVDGHRLFVPQNHVGAALNREAVIHIGRERIAGNAGGTVAFMVDFHLFQADGTNTGSHTTEQARLVRNIDGTLQGAYWGAVGSATTTSKQVTVGGRTLTFTLVTRVNPDDADDYLVEVETQIDNGAWYWEVSAWIPRQITVPTANSFAKEYIDNDGSETSGRGGFYNPANKHTLNGGYLNHITGILKPEASETKGSANPLYELETRVNGHVNTEQLNRRWNDLGANLQSLIKFGNAAYYSRVQFFYFDSLTEAEAWAANSGVLGAGLFTYDVPPEHGQINSDAGMSMPSLILAGREIHAGGTPLHPLIGPDAAETKRRINSPTNANTNARGDTTYIQTEFTDIDTWERVDLQFNAEVGSVRQNSQVLSYRITPQQQADVKAGNRVTIDSEVDVHIGGVTYDLHMIVITKDANRGGKVDILIINTATSGKLPPETDIVLAAYETNPAEFSAQSAGSATAAADARRVADSAAVAAQNAQDDADAAQASADNAANAARVAQTAADSKLSAASSDATLTGDGTAASPLSVANPFTDADETKLDGIEAGATADQTAGEIKTAYESNADTNAFTDAEKTKLAGIPAGGGGGGGISISPDAITADDTDNASAASPKQVADFVRSQQQGGDETTAGTATIVSGAGAGGTGGQIGYNSGYGTIQNNAFTINGAATALLLVYTYTSGEFRDELFLNMNPMPPRGQNWRFEIEGGGRTYTAERDDCDDTRYAGLCTLDLTADEITALQAIMAPGQTFTFAIKQAAASGGLTSVTSDSTLTGDGTGANPLKVATPFTSAEKTKLGGIEEGATADQTAQEIKTAYESNADTNAFTDGEKTKLAGIAAGAQVNVKPDWNAPAGSAAEILNKPDIPSGGGGGVSISPDAITVGDTDNASATSPKQVSDYAAAKTDIHTNKDYVLVAGNDSGSSLSTLVVAGALNQAITITLPTGSTDWRTGYTELLLLANRSTTEAEMIRINIKQLKVAIDNLSKIGASFYRVGTSGANATIGVNGWSATQLILRSTAQWTVRAIYAR